MLRKNDDLLVGDRIQLTESGARFLTTAGQTCGWVTHVSNNRRTLSLALTTPEKFAKARTRADVIDAAATAVDVHEHFVVRAFTPGDLVSYLGDADGLTGQDVMVLEDRYATEGNVLVRTSHGLLAVAPWDLVPIRVMHRSTQDSFAEHMRARRAGHA